MSLSALKTNPFSVPKPTIVLKKEWQGNLPKVDWQNHFPEELWLYTFKFLQLVDLKNLKGVCNRIYALAFDAISRLSLRMKLKDHWHTFLPRGESQLLAISLSKISLIHSKTLMIEKEFSMKEDIGHLSSKLLGSFKKYLIINDLLLIHNKNNQSIETISLPFSKEHPTVKDFAYSFWKRNAGKVKAMALIDPSYFKDISSKYRLGNIIATAETSQTIKFWNIKNKKCLKTITINLNIFSFLHMNENLILGEVNGDISKFNLKTEKIIPLHKKHTSFVSLKIEGEYFVSCSGDNTGTLTLWNRDHQVFNKNYSFKILSLQCITTLTSEIIALIHQNSLQIIELSSLRVIKKIELFKMHGAHSVGLILQGGSLLIYIHCKGDHEKSHTEIVALRHLNF